MRNASRGFTLVEMLIGLVLLGIVSTTIYRVLTTNQRLSRAQTEQVSLQSSVRLGALAVANELREIGINSAGGTDILAMSANGITYRAMRSSGMACAVTTTQVTIRNTATTFYSTRNIVAVQDSLVLYVESDSTISTDDAWVVLPITAVAGTTCGGAAAIALTTTIPAGTVANVKLDAPVRTFEVMELGVTAVGGQNWLGVRSVSAGQAMQAALGPIAANGLDLEYYTTAAGTTTTTNRAQVQSIRINIRGVTDRTVRAAGQDPLALDTDSLAMRITLRNAPHP